jgi:hypothetical protein
VLDSRLTGCGPVRRCRVVRVLGYAGLAVVFVLGLLPDPCRIESSSSSSNIETCQEFRLVRIDQALMAIALINSMARRSRIDAAA